MRTGCSPLSDMSSPKRSPDPGAAPGAPPSEGKRAVRSRPPSAESEERATLQRERQRVADVLHNTVCQELTGICLLASAASHEYRSVSPAAAEKLMELAGMIQCAGVGLHEFLRVLRSEDGK